MTTTPTSDTTTCTDCREPLHRSTGGWRHTRTGLKTCSDCTQCGPGHTIPGTDLCERHGKRISDSSRVLDRAKNALWRGGLPK